MKIYLISPNKKIYMGKWDYYESAVVCAESRKDAITIHPDDTSNYKFDTWCKSEFVDVEYIGQAKTYLKRGVICSSFNAG